MLLSLQFVYESRLFHNNLILETQVDFFNTRQLFRPLGTRQWFPPHAFGAQGSANHFESVCYFPRAAWSPNVKLIRVIPAS